MHEFSISLPEEADSVKIGTDGKATITTFFKQSVYSHGNCVLHHRYLLYSPLFILAYRKRW